MHTRVLNTFLNKFNISLKSVLAELSLQNADSEICERVFCEMVHRIKCENSQDFYTLLSYVAKNKVVVKLLMENENNRIFFVGSSPDVMADLVTMMTSSEMSNAFFKKMVSNSVSLAQLTANSGEVIKKLKEVLDSKPEFFQQLISNIHQRVPMDAKLVVSELKSQYGSSAAFRAFIGGNIKLTKPPVATPLIDDIIKKLNEYTNRIDTEGVDNFRLFLFKGNRIANRKINYQIAENIKKALQNRDPDKDELEVIRDVFKDYHYSFTNLYMFVQTNYNGATHSIRSGQLMSIIDYAKEMVEKKQSNSPLV